MTGIPERQPDIEIYVHRISSEQAIDWLRELGSVSELKTGRQKARLTLEANGARIPVLVLENCCDGYTSIWFKSDRTPWACDLDCAEAAFRALGRPVRAIRGGWNEGDDPDEWWQLDQNGLTRMRWRTDP